MTKFYLPYQFIPVTGKVKRNGETQETSKTPWDQIADIANPQPARHDLWLDDKHSGRIICRLHLQTPTFVGKRQEPDPKKENPTEVEHYQRDNKPAIPGNSLRGMIGSVTEMLSQSALRVLEDRKYSIRKTLPGGALSALGRIKMHGKEHYIEPLTLPVMEKNAEGFFQLEPLWKEVFRGIPFAECLSAYVEGYYKNGMVLDYRSNSFLSTKPNSYGPGNEKERWYARLPNTELQTLLAEQRIPAGISCLRLDSRHEKFLLGQTIEGNPVTETNKRSDDDACGFLRVLGIEEREAHLPPKKEHELFIIEPDRHKRRREIRVPPDVIEQFCTLARERAEATKGQKLNLPFLPQGYKPNFDDWLPKEDMLFFFDVEKREGKIVVSEISLSAIWRQFLDSKNSTYEFFRSLDSANKDLLPWGTERRTGLTPAELLFGVVEQKKQKKTGRNLASRLRFSDARFAPNQDPEFDTEVTLKILASPKPPSPALYFHPRNSPRRHIAKRELDSREHLPNGRKVYLHHQTSDVEIQQHDGNRRWWETKDDSAERKHLKLRCKPLASGQDLRFHIDFDNLDDAELTLLRTALCPSENFRHRLGLGKSLGLGTVEVVIEGIFFVNRKARYDIGALDEPRYQNVWLTCKDLPWKGLYEAEASALRASRTAKLYTLVRDQSYIDRETLELLCTVGDPAKLEPDVHVHTPLRENQVPQDRSNGEQAKAEKDTFKWFTKNDEKDACHQALRPIVLGQPLPILHADFVPMQLYIGNLPYETTEDEIRALVESHWTVCEIRMIFDRNTGGFRGFCFVTVHQDEADAVIQALNGFDYGGRTLRVNPSN